MSSLHGGRGVKKFSLNLFFRLFGIRKAIPSGSHLIEPTCVACGRPCATIRLTKEGESFRFVYRGLLSGNGGGDLITGQEATNILTAFSHPFLADKIGLADLYDDGGFCRQCEKFYCVRCWNASVTGGGRCPAGHFKSLDPHWSPDE
jgi:hypothetical protein